MRISQRIVVGAAAAASVMGGMGAALAADRSPDQSTTAVGTPEATSVVLDAQAATKKRLWATYAEKHTAIDRLMDRLSSAEDTLRQARQTQAVAAAAAAQQAATQYAAPSVSTQTTQPAPSAATTTTAPTTQTTTGASGAAGSATGDDGESESHDD
ncbi:MAG: hypothetical protein WAN48_05920 [Actinomycetes bacterium]